MTDTLCLARDFGKPHKEVLRAVHNLKYSAKFGRHNSVPSECTDGQGGPVA
jgi:hypothetical protein